MDAANNGSALVELSHKEDGVSTLMRRATDVAGVCREIVTRTAKTIQGRKYVCVEGWQSIAAAYGFVASARDVERVYDNTGVLVGVRAVGELRKATDGTLLSTAEGFVGEDEPVWSGGMVGNKSYERRPEYARRAMAQTRAISRACRGPLAFVVTLIDSGLSTTPSEEMDGVVVEGSVTPPPPSGSAGLKAKLAGPQPTPPPAKQSAENAGEKPSHDRSVSFRFGKSANTPLHSLTEGDLKFYENCLKNDIASNDPKKQQYAAANTLALTNVQAEIRFRGI